jgi:hypothetical protein
VLLYRLRDAGRVLDHLAADVQHVQRAVRGVGELRGAEPDVLGREELLPLVHPLGPEQDAAGRLEHLAVDEVRADVADERLAAVLGREGVAAVDGDAGRAR